MLREVVDQNCVGGISRASARAAGVNFKRARPTTPPSLGFRIKGLRTVRKSVAQTSFTHIRFDMSRSANRLATWTHRRQRGIVSDLLNVARSLTVDWSRCAPVTEPRLRNTGGSNLQESERLGDSRILP